MNNSWPYEITHANAWVCRLRNRVLQHCHYSDDTRASWRSKSPSAWQFAPPHAMTESKRNSQTPWLGTKSFVILKSRFEALLLQWPYMRVMLFQIPCHSIFCSTVYPGQKQRKHHHSLIGDILISNTEITFCSIVITVSSHEHHGVPNHRLLDNLLNGMSWLRAKETSTHFIWERNHL